MSAARKSKAKAAQTSQTPEPGADAQAPAPKPVRVKSRKIISPDTATDAQEAVKPESSATAQVPAVATKSADKPFARPEMVMPTNSAAVVNNLIAREINDPSGSAEPVSPTVNVLSGLSRAVALGQDLSSIKSDILRLISNQPEKAAVFQSVLNIIDQERTADMVEIRAIVEKQMKRAVKRGDLTTHECLAVWEIANNVIQENQAKAVKNTKAVDTTTVIEKVEYHSESEHIIQQKWEGTTPQGRQIIRMKLFDLKRKVQKLHKTFKEEKEADDESEESDKQESQITLSKQMVNAELALNANSQPVTDVKQA